MIILNRKKDCRFCDEIEEALKDMVLNYKRVFVSENENRLNDNIEIPYFNDDGEIISGKSNIREYLAKLEKTVSDWRKFQSDSCYFDDDGSVC